MSISMKSILAAAVASLVVGNAMAADGTINFKGEITAAACSITGGAGTTVGGAAGNQTIDVNLGKISIDSLSGTAGGSIAGGTSLNLNLDCGKTGTGLTTVKLKFDPMSGTGIDSHNESLLKLGKDSTATGVGIGIYGSDGKLLNLSANETIDAPLNSRVEKKRWRRPRHHPLQRQSESAGCLRKVWRCGRYGRCCQRLPALHPGIQLSSATWAGYVYTPLHEV